MPSRKALGVGLINVLLRVVFVASPRLYRHRDPANLVPRRILISRPDHIGDAVLATPTVRAVRRRFPLAHITFAVASWSAPLFVGNADIDELFLVDPPWWIRKRGLAPAAFTERMRIWRRFLARLLELRRRHFDLCLELRGDVRQILAFGIFTKVGMLLTFRRNGGHFLADRWLYPRLDRHESAQGLDLAALLGCDVSDAVPRIDAGQAAARAVHELLDGMDMKAGESLVVVHPSAKPANTWPEAHFDTLLRGLTSTENVRVLLTGGPADRALHERLVAIDARRIQSCAGLGLAEVSVLISRADLMITADTGPMHLLNGTDTASVLLFGPTRPEQFAPIGHQHEVLSAGWCCSQALHDTCLLDPCAASGKCMTALTPKRVMFAASAALARTRLQQATTG